MFGRVFRILIFEKKRAQLLCLEEKGQNEIVWKDKVKIPKYGSVRSVIQCLEG